MRLTTEFRNRCETIALDERRALGLRVFDPLHGEELAERHGAIVVQFTQLPKLFSGFSEEMAQTLIQEDKVSGFLLQLPVPGFVPHITVHPYHAPTRRQSTLMHEIAHLLLKHESENLEDLLTGTRNRAQEYEAAHLGGCLQIPRTALVWASQTGLSLKRTAVHFGASEAMVTYRSRINGIQLR